MSSAVKVTVQDISLSAFVVVFRGGTSVYQSCFKQSLGQNDFIVQYTDPTYGFGFRVNGASVYAAPSAINVMSIPSSVSMSQPLFSTPILTVQQRNLAYSGDTDSYPGMQYVGAGTWGALAGESLPHLCPDTFLTYLPMGRTRDGTTALLPEVHSEGRGDEPFDGLMGCACAWRLDGGDIPITTGVVIKRKIFVPVPSNGWLQMFSSVATVGEPNPDHTTLSVAHVDPGSLSMNIDVRDPIGDTRNLSSLARTDRLVDSAVLRSVRVVSSSSGAGQTIYAIMSFSVRGCCVVSWTGIQRVDPTDQYAAATVSGSCSTISSLECDLKIQYSGKSTTIPVSITLNLYNSSRQLDFNIVGITNIIIKPTATSTSSATGQDWEWGWWKEARYYGTIIIAIVLLIVLAGCLCNCTSNGLSVCANRQKKTVRDD